MSTLESLPAELRLSIISHLPARDIQRYRAVSRSFRDLIDLEENHTLCILPGVNASLSRIQETHDSLCNYFVDSFDEQGRYKSILDAFRDFLRIFGFEPAWTATRVFARHFGQRVIDHSGLPNYIRDVLSEPQSLVWLLDEVCLLHWCFHGGRGIMQDAALRSLGVRTLEKNDFIANVTQGWIDDFDLSEEDAADMFRRIEDGVLLGMLNASTSTGCLHSHILHWQLQPSQSPILLSWASRPRSRDLRMSNGLTSRILGVPMIPDSMALIYNVRSSSALEAMNNAATGQSLSLIMKAAILEELGVIVPQQRS